MAAPSQSNECAEPLTTVSLRPPPAAASPAGPLVAAAGMGVFAFFAHCRYPVVLVSAVGLLAAACVVGRALIRCSSPWELFGLARPIGRALAVGMVGLFLGVGLGIAYRLECGQPLLPSGFAAFALLAAAIGSAEELLYRGYMQGQFVRLISRGAAFNRRLSVSSLQAIALAAVFHAAYKTLLFAGPSVAVQVDLEFLAVCTVAAGVVFGALRELSRSIYPCIAAHAAFDLIVYAQCAQSPWWVWS